MPRYSANMRAFIDDGLNMLGLLSPTPTRRRRKPDDDRLFNQLVAYTQTARERSLTEGEVVTVTTLLRELQDRIAEPRRWTSPFTHGQRREGQPWYYWLLLLRPHLPEPSCARVTIAWLLTRSELL